MRQSENQLLDEIALREASIADAQREREAGELTAIQAATIEARETLALARLRQELSELTFPSAKGPDRKRRLAYLVIGLVCLLAVIVIVLLHSLSLRQAGTQETGGVTVSHSQEITQLLTEAQSDVANGQVTAALAAYEDVLSYDPKNVTALTQIGWLDFSAGSSSTNPSLVTLGVNDLREAITYGPTNAAARLYYAIVADSTPGNTSLAIAQFKVFLALHPSRGQLAIAHPFLVALKLPTS
jgi:cytochrome c-type biogenesis protein CcmH/NrfG